MTRKIRDTIVQRFEAGEFKEKKDQIVAEEPLELRLVNCDTGEDAVLAVTMRTPGNDAELVLGLSFSEGVIRELGDVHSITTPEEGGDAVLAMSVSPANFSRFSDSASLNRHFLMGSSCGICGKTAIDNIHDLGFTRIAATHKISADFILELAKSMSEEQKVFSKTGGLHAAGLFNPSGEVIVVREDIGRHNAVDKVTGYSLKHCPEQLSDHALLVSGRLSYEMVQKAISLGVGILAAVSAPSDLAIATAHEFGVTLIGFLRGRSFNIYTHPERIKPAREVKA